MTDEVGSDRGEIERIWQALEAVVLERGGKPDGREIVFLCPTHSDHNPSARWHPEKHVWNCFTCGGGGGAFDLAKRLGVELPSGERGLALDELASYVGLPAEFLRSVGVSQGVAGVERSKCVDIAYTDEHGELQGVRKRLRLNGEPRTVWRRGDHVLPYGLARLVSARHAGYVILVEGESDAWTAWHGNVPAVGLPGASTWKETRERQPGKYQPGEPLPQSRPPLPTMEELYEHMCVPLLETGRHAATPGSLQVQREPAASVADTVTSESATHPATLDCPSSDSESNPSGLAWRRGVVDPAMMHTSLSACARPAGDVEEVQPGDAQLALFAAGLPPGGGEAKGAQGHVAGRCPECGQRPTIDSRLCFRCEPETLP